MGKNWDVGLFDCCQNCSACLFAMLVPCGSHYLQIRAYEKITGGGFWTAYCMMCALGTCANAIIRGKIRERYGIDGSLYNDWCVWGWCYYCASVQEITQVTKFEVVAPNYEGGVIVNN